MVSTLICGVKRSDATFRNAYAQPNFRSLGRSGLVAIDFDSRSVLMTRMKKMAIIASALVLAILIIVALWQ